MSDELVKKLRDKTERVKEIREMAESGRPFANGGAIDANKLASGTIRAADIQAGSIGKPLQVVYIVLRKKRSDGLPHKGEFCSVFEKREDAERNRDIWNERRDQYNYFIVTTPVVR